MIAFFQGLSATVQAIIALIAGLLIGLLFATALVTFKYEGLEVFGYPIIPGIVHKRLEAQSETFVTKADHARLEAELEAERVRNRFAAERNARNQEIIMRYQDAQSQFERANALNRVNAQNLQDEIDELLLRPATGIPTVSELDIRLRHAN